MRCSSCTCNHGLRVWEAFGLYGKKVSKNPIAALIIAVLMNTLLAINMRWMKVTDNYQELYIDTTSDASLRANQIRNSFPYLGKNETYPWQLADKTVFGRYIVNTNENIITAKYRIIIRKIHEAVLDIQVKDKNNVEHDFKDLCIRNDIKCLQPGSIFFDNSFLSDYSLQNASYPVFIDSNGLPHIMSEIIGNVEVENGILTSARSLKLTYHLRSDIEQAIVDEWEEKFLKTLTSLNTSNINLFMETSNSKTSDLPPVYLVDPKVLVIMFGVFCVFAFVAGLGGNCISQRGNLALASVLSGCLSVLSALGFCSAIGVSYVNFTTIMPLFTIGLSVTKAFVLLSGVTNAPIKASPEERVTYGIKATGVPTTFASASIFIALLVCGLVSDLQVLKHFCWFTGSAVVLTYINHMTFFISCVVFDEKRVASKRHWCACHSVYSLEEMRAAGYRNNFMVVCCSGAPAENKEEIRSFTDNVSSMILPRFLLLKPVKVIVILTYVLYLALAIWGCTTLKIDFLDKDTFKEDSSIQTYLLTERRNFDNRVPISLNIEGNVDYWNIQRYNEIQKIIITLKNERFIDDSFEVNWLSSFYHSSTFTNSSGADFIAALKLFLKANQQFENDILINENGTNVPFSKVYILSENLKETSDLVAMFKIIKQIVSRSYLEIYAYSPNFVHLEQLVQTWEKSAMSVFVTFGVCLLFAILFIQHPTTILYIMFSVVSIMSGVAGFMSFLEETINSFTLVYFSILTGFSFLFPSFVCNIFLYSNALDRRSKASETIVIVSGTILISCVIFVITSVSLVFANTNIFLTFFKIVVMLLVISIFHCVFLLPIILSLIGPVSPYSLDSNRDNSKSLLFPNKSSLTWSIAGVNAFDAPFSPMKISRSRPLKESENKL